MTNKFFLLCGRKYLETWYGGPRQGSRVRIRHISERRGHIFEKIVDNIFSVAHSFPDKWLYCIVGTVIRTTNNDNSNSDYRRESITFHPPDSLQSTNFQYAECA